MYWNPNDHPRGSDGRFIEKINAIRKAGVDLPYDKHGGLNEMELDRLYESLKQKEKANIGLEIFGKKKDRSNDPTPEVPQNVCSFRNKVLLYRDDHIAHAKYFGFVDQRKYEKFCADFWNSNRGSLYYTPDSRRFIRNEGLLVCYVSLDGYIHTMFEFSSEKEKEKYEKQQHWRKVDG